VKSPAKAPADVTVVAKDVVTNGRGSSFGKYPLVNRSTSDRVQLTSSIRHRIALHFPKFRRTLLITAMVSFGKSVESIHSKYSRSESATSRIILP
jgi:hypothetical protein